MALLNIGEANQGDAFYRYKMPQLQAKIEGRGNGIKTNVVNMVDIAKALSRSPAYTTKYFGCELGAQSKFDDKTGTSIVNGAHSADTLSQLLDGFIKRFVCCYACGNPETEIKVSKKKEDITLLCKACGNVSRVDMRHKLATFILKNPPNDPKSGADKKMRRAEKERMKTGELLDEEEKARKREAKKKAKEEAKAAEREERRKRKEEKRKLREAAMADGTADEENGARPRSDRENGSPEDDEDEDEVDEGSTEEDDKEENGVEWFTDTSAAAAAKRAQEQLSAETAKLVVVDEAPPVDPIDALACELRAACTSDAVDASAWNAWDVVLAGRPLEVQYAAVLSCLWDPSSKLKEQAMTHKDVLLVRVEDDPKHQLALLVGLEHYLSRCSAEKRTEGALVLKVWYEEDVAVEPVIEHWYERSACASTVGVDAKQAASIRAAVRPYVEWLRQAESEDSDDA